MVHNTQNSLTSSINKTQILNNTSRLVAKNLKKSHTNLEAIVGINLDISAPGVFAILGQNGAGKTSLIKCSLGLEQISSGLLNTMGHKPGALKAKQN
jgi:ABC-type multidrug transport system ATPase subunit